MNANSANRDHIFYPALAVLGRVSVLLVVVMTLTGVLVLTVRVEEATRTGAPQIWLL